MSDRGRRFEQDRVEWDRVESDLEALGSRINYPATPDLARGVRQRLEATESTGERPARHGRISWMTFSPRWAVAAVALVLAVSLPLLSETARDTLSGVFVSGSSSGSAASGGASSGSAGGEAASGEAASGGSGAAPFEGSQDGVTVSGSASQGSSGADEAVTGASREFGDPLTLERARNRLDDKLLLPRARGLGEPEEVYDLGKPRSAGVALVYLQRPGLPSLGGTGAGLVLIEIPGDLRSMYSGRDLAKQSEAEETRVGRGRGYWITGREELAPPLDQSVHPPANVLVWEQGGLVLRLETGLPRDEAVRLAESLR